MFITKQSDKFISLLNFWETIGKQEYINKPKELSVSLKVKNLIEKFQPKEKIFIKNVHLQNLNNCKENHQIDFLNYQFSCSIILVKNVIIRLPNVNVFEKEKLSVKNKQLLRFNELLKQYISYNIFINKMKCRKYDVLKSLTCTNNEEGKQIIMKQNIVKEQKRGITNGFSCELEEIIVDQIINLIYEEGFKWLVTIAPSLLKGIIILNFFSNFF